MPATEALQNKTSRGNLTAHFNATMETEAVRGMGMESPEEDNLPLILATLPDF